MLDDSSNFIKKYILSGHERSIKAKKNIILSIFFKFFDIIIGLLLVPLYLKYLGQNLYGIWLTLTSIVLWFRFLNLGLGNGLRNKYIEAKAKGEFELLRHYISTTYVLISVIVFLFFIVFLLFNPFLNWQAILKYDSTYSAEISILIYITFFAFGLSLILNLIDTLLLAEQEPSKSNLLNLISRGLILSGIIVLGQFEKKSIVYIGCLFSFAPVLVYIIASFFLYHTKYSYYKPSLKYFRLKDIPDLSGLGLKFFTIQITAIVLFASDNFIITQLFNAGMVAPYQIANKYFNILYMIFLIIIQPIWSAVGDAYHKQDFLWLKNAEKKLLVIWFLFCILIVLMLSISSKVFALWIGNTIQIDFSTSFVWALFMVLSTYNAIYTNFINGIGKLRIQLLIAFYALIAKIPLSIIFAKNLHWGVEGVLYATITSVILSSVFKTVQYKKLISGNAYGIWNK